jgi:very-short-patch-repair endonuclease
MVSIAQLRDAGLGRGAVAHRVRRGLLHPQHRGVYAYGTGVLRPLGREAAAVLAVPRAVLSDGSAAAAWGVLPFDPGGPVHVIANRCRSREGIVVHHAQALLPGDVRVHRGLPLTSPARTVLDLAPGLSDSALERLLAEVLTLDPQAGADLGRRGTKRIQRLLGHGPRRTRSQNERRLLEVIRQAGLPVPRTNTEVHGFEVDAYWPEHRLVVEVDDFFTHGDRRSFVKDRRRDAALHTRGVTTLRITSTDLDGPPARVAATLAGALARTAAA